MKNIPVYKFKPYQVSHLKDKNTIYIMHPYNDELFDVNSLPDRFVLEFGNKLLMIKKLFQRDVIFLLIGLINFDLYLPMVSSLKEKRSIIKSLIKKSRNKFNLAVSETDDNELWKNANISAVTVSNERKYIDSLFSKYVNFIDEIPELELRDYKVEIF